MATSSTTKKSSAVKSSAKKDLTFVWLDDSAGQDPNAKAMFLTLFDQVFIFREPTACLELVESADDETPCISILISGAYGQLIVRDRLQPLPQVKDIYVFCYNIAKHNQWAQTCDKVRCVESDFNTILKRLQKDVHKKIKQPNEDQPQSHETVVEEEEVVEPIVREPERFTDDINLYDHLALNLLLQNPKDDGIDDFKKYCQTFPNEGENDLKAFKPDGRIRDWYKENLLFLKLNSTDVTQLWALRWFISIFHQQLTNEYEDLIKKEAEITVHYATWLNTDELDAMKHRIGQSIISTGLLLAHGKKRRALESIENKQDEQRIHRVLLEIHVDTSIRPTVPYGGIRDNEVLFWFGSRFQLTKIELIKPKEENEEPYWLIGLSLSSTFDVNQSIETLYQYYLDKLTALNDLHHAFGRILMYKGLYYQAEKWFQTSNHSEELAELAIRQNQIERASQYLTNASEESDDANLLRAYVNLLTSGENVPKGRTILMKICSEATDRIVRARANIALGFINLIVSQQVDQASDYFRMGYESLSKNLPDIHPDIAKAWIGLGYTYFTQKNKEEAVKAFRKALKIQNQSLISNHPDFAKTHNGLGHCLATEKPTIKQALNEFECAFHILIQAFPREYKTHPEILLTKQDSDKVRKGKELRARNTLLDYI